VRHYVPLDDGQEPTGWEGYVDYPAKNGKEPAARVYVCVYVERDPEKSAALDARQNAAILELLLRRPGVPAPPPQPPHVERPHAPSHPAPPDAASESAHL
jgi:hypothetical protein